MTQSLPISDLVQVTINVSPVAAPVQGFNVGLIVGTGTELPLDQRIRAYTELTGGVDADFASNTLEYQFAQAWFSQSPVPSAPLLIGRWFTAAQSAKLRGGAVATSATLAALITALQAITTGGFDISINGTNKQLSSLNFGSIVTMADAAAVLQTALAAAVASTTCTWNATTYQLTITDAGTTGTGSTLGFALPPTHSGSPVDVSSLLALTSTLGAAVYQGIAIETMTAALTALAAFNPTWCGVVLTSVVAQDQKDAAAWAQSNGKLFFATTSDANAEDGTQTSDLAYFFQNLAYTRSPVFFDNVNPATNEGASAMARLFSWNPAQPNSIVALMYKQAPGFAPVTLTETQRLALEAKNCNYYASFGGNNMFARGTTPSGRFIDEIIGLDWLQSVLQNALFQLMLDEPGRIPGTDQGTAREKDALNAEFEAAKNAGLIASGIWQGAPVGEVDTGDLLKDGYYVYIAPVSSQSAADRAARKSPPITAICIGAGAIQSAQVTVNFQR